MRMPAPRHLRAVARPRAAAEGLFHRIRAKVEKIAETLSHPFEEIINFLGRAQQKYLVNFSTFQSIPDAWSIATGGPQHLPQRTARRRLRRRPA